MKKYSIFFVLALNLIAAGTAMAQDLTVHQIMAEPSIAGMRPDSQKLSPDGRWALYAWNPEAKEPRNLYIADTYRGESRLLLPAPARPQPPENSAPENKLNYGLELNDEFSRSRSIGSFSGVEFSPDSMRILYPQGGDLNVLDFTAPNAKPRRVMRVPGIGGARWLDNQRILYQSSGNYFVLDLGETSITQVTRDSNPEKFITISNASAPRNGQLLAYVLSDSSAQRALFVPNYLGEFVQAPSFRRGFSSQKVYVAPTDGSRMRPFDVNLPKPEGASYIRSLKWAADNASLIVDRIDRDLKRRQLFYVHNVGSKAEQIITVTEETDEKWVASLSRIVEPNPKAPWQILFASERDGFNHVYLATLERAKAQPNPTGEPRQENPTDPGFTSNIKIEQLTKGNFEIDWAKWSADGDEIIFSSTEENTAERQFYSLAYDFKDKRAIQAPEKGMMTNPQLNDGESDHPVLLYEFSQWNRPTELFASVICPRCAGATFPMQLSKSTPEAFKQIKFTEPKFIDIPTKDGKQIKAKVYLPDEFAGNTAGKTFPMVFFVHGAGYLQNTINGWNNYSREFMFNEIMVRKGYVVLDIDYRGSAGYGRDWRTDVYDFLGGLDMQDHLDAIDFAIKNYSVDARKIGVYGGSYGGFMAEMLVFRAPDKIAAAAALRPVADWKNYYASSPVYTAERLGFPDKNPEGYKRSSPIAYAEKLERPLLILHGLVDNNVPAQDSIQLIEKLIRLEKTKYFETMFYPSENHAFDRPASWTDEYTRILNFFDKHLK